MWRIDIRLFWIYLFCRFGSETMKVFYVIIKQNYFKKAITKDRKKKTTMNWVGDTTTEKEIISSGFTTLNWLYNPSPHILLRTKRIAKLKKHTYLQYILSVMLVEFHGYGGIKQKEYFCWHYWKSEILTWVIRDSDVRIMRLN